LLAFSAGTLPVPPRTEAAGLAAAIPENAAIIALDSRGEALSSRIYLAGRLGKWRDRGHQP
jgi:23S rRNA pseudoU1915 N3-methylase RlmH